LKDFCRKNGGYHFLFLDNGNISASSLVNKRIRPLITQMFNHTNVPSKLNSNIMRPSKGSKKKSLLPPLVLDRLGFHFLYMIEHCSVHAFGMEDWTIGKIKEKFLHSPFHRKP